MEMGDEAIGLVSIMTGLSIFTCYTFLVIILVLNFYLKNIHVFAGVVLLSFFSIFVSLVMLKSKKKKKSA